MRYSLRTLLIALAIVPPALAVALGEEPQSDATKKELDKVQGEWLLVFWRFDGKDLDAAKELGAIGDKTTMMITGHRYIIAVGDTVYEEGTAEIDPTTSPAKFDTTATIIAGQPKKDMRSGICILKDDLLIVCVNYSEKRPTTFSAEAGSKSEIVIYRRMKK